MDLPQSGHPGFALPATALLHFREDIARARAILTHADPLPTNAIEQLLRSDLLRSAWMLAVGAMDAYFCDASTDIVAATASSKSRQPAIILPEWVYDIKIPIRAVLEEYDHTNWRWRMAARKMMECENIISLAAIQTLFNFFRKGHKFFRDLFNLWLARPDSRIRLFGIARADDLAMNDGDQHRARGVALDQFEDRFRAIFQLRHDCIHYCDRPRMSPQPLAQGGTVLKVFQDVEFLVNRSDEPLTSEFRDSSLEWDATRRRLPRPAINKGSTLDQPVSFSMSEPTRATAIGRFWPKSSRKWVNTGRKKGIYPGRESARRVRDHDDSRNTPPEVAPRCPHPTPRSPPIVATPP